MRKSAPPESSTMISGRIGVGLRIDGETSVIIRIKEGNSDDGPGALVQDPSCVSPPPQLKREWSPYADLRPNPLE